MPSQEFIERATNPTTAYRVTYGWGCFEDFEDLPSALEWMADLLRQPMKDPLCQRVSLLDTTPEAHAEHDYFPTLVMGRRSAP